MAGVARQSSLRETNLGTVLGRVLAADRPPSRADLAAATGLTRSTVSRLVDELIEHRLVAELDAVGAGTRGRPAVPLVAAPASWVGLGLEVNVRHLAVSLVDLTGTVLATHFEAGEFGESQPEAVLRRLAELGREALAEAPAGLRLARVCLAVPGLVDAARGVLLRAPNLGWGDVAASALVTDALGAGVAVDLANEADCAAALAARDAPGGRLVRSDFLLVSGEVGIGSALVVGGTIASGRHGWAGEIGHVCVDPDGPRCACGARGCLEAFAGERALCEAAGVADRAGLTAALAARDPRARLALAQAGTSLGIALSAALNLLDVSHVVLAGHLGMLADHLLGEVRSEIADRVVAASFAPLDAEAADLGVAPASLGAAYRALEALLREPALAW